MSIFEKSYENYKAAWRNFSLEDLKRYISTDYRCREIRGDEIIDFGYEESIEGWAQAFEYFGDKNARWIIKDLGLIPLKEDEMMVILTATLEIDGESIETANLFFETYKRTNDQEWVMVRSYIETGISLSRLEEFKMQF